MIVPYVARVQGNPNSAVQPFPPPPPLEYIPVFEVAFHDGMWWSIPKDLSQALYEKYIIGEDAC